MDEKSGKQVAAESGDTQQEPGESRSGGDGTAGEELASGIGLSRPSAGSLRQPTSRPRSRLQREQDELEDYVEDLIERRLQAAKDKRLRRLEEEIQELSERVDRREAHREPPAPAGAVSQPAVEWPAAAGRTAARASHLIQPSGGGLPPALDLRADYERRVGALRPGDVTGLLEIKREFRKKGLDVY